MWFSIVRAILGTTLALAFTSVVEAHMKFTRLAGEENGASILYSLGNNPATATWAPGGSISISVPVGTMPGNTPFMIKTQGDIAKCTLEGPGRPTGNGDRVTTFFPISTTVDDRGRIMPVLVQCGCFAGHLLKCTSTTTGRGLSCRENTFNTKCVGKHYGWTDPGAPGW